MCGICGIIGNGHDSSRSRISSMLDRIAHRGPDGHGYWKNEVDNVALGHARLAIIDVTDAGNQPMHHPKNLHSVVNGEIYNYPTLRKELEQKYGAKFSSNCDSEVVLHGYLAEGLEFYKRMNGMFAFALYDAEQQMIHLVRDRLGIKPIYYTFYEGQLLFGSEIKALFGAMNTDNWPIDEVGLSQFMTYQTALGDRTMFKGVHLLKPGHILSIHVDRISDHQVRPFWQSQTKIDNKMTFDGAVDRYKQVFARSVDRHLLSDVPVATYISAGFDSSSVSVQAARIHGQSLSGYTGWFDIEGGWYDERSAAAKAISSVNGKHVPVCINETDFIQELDNIIDVLDEPKMGMGAFPQYMVAKAAAQDFKVILTGHGGDELFSGYPVFKLAQKGGLVSVKTSEIPHLIYFGLSGVRANLSPEFGRYMPVLWSLSDQSKMMSYDVYDQEPWRELEAIQEPCDQVVDQIYQTYLNAYLAGLLVVEDKISMAHSLESRTPILDNEMLDLSLSIPQSIKLHDSQLKAIIKEAGKDLLPNSFYEQPKRGFPTPLRMWLRGALKGVAEERLLGSQSRLSRLFDQKILERIVSSYRKSPCRYVRPLDEIQSHRMWQLLSLEAWLRIWEEKYGVTLRLQ